MSVEGAPRFVETIALVVVAVGHLAAVAGIRQQQRVATLERLGRLRQRSENALRAGLLIQQHERLAKLALLGQRPHVAGVVLAARQRAVPRAAQLVVIVVGVDSV